MARAAPIELGQPQTLLIAMNLRGISGRIFMKAIGPDRRRVSAQAVLCSAKKLSGGSASSGVNRGSKRKRVPQ
jgi:hypothetical protein